MAQDDENPTTRTTQVDVGTSVTTGARRQTFPVTSSNGEQIELMTAKEAAMYAGARDKYLSENVFSVASDIRALDRLVLFEIQAFRYLFWLGQDADYDFVPLSVTERTAIRRSLKDTELAITTLQNDLGLTFSQRQKAVNKDSVGEYIADLKIRAKEHGYMRDAQLGKAIELMNEVISQVGAFRRANANERMKLGFKDADEILEWIEEVIQPTFQEVDRHYRDTNQRFWIRRA